MFIFLRRFALFISVLLQKIGIVGLGGLGHLGVKFAVAMNAEVINQNNKQNVVMMINHYYKGDSILHE